MDILQRIWPHVTAALVLLASLTAAGHAVLYKRNPRSAVGWIGIIFLFPVLGVVLYVVLGINRVQRRAAKLRVKPPLSCMPEHPAHCTPEALRDTLPVEAKHLAVLARIVDGITMRPLLNGNSVWPLLNGDAAYPSMLDAIDRAERSVSLCTYIFAHDEAGRMFTEALSRAVARGVEARVLIDYVGSRYSFPPAAGMLHRAGVRAAMFMPTSVPWRTPYTNLRSHRKVLVVDGRVGFTGGINIRGDNVLNRRHPEPIQDLHFRVAGPVVGHLQEVFAEDWNFCTREVLEGDTWFPRLAGDGPVRARGIADGPDEEHDRMRRTILGALACAQRSVRIATPYFLPDEALFSALSIAAMRGVDIEILLPEKNNLRLVGWAAMAQLWQVLQRGCRVWLTAPPFDHTKLMVVDGAWALVGSANWDPRSLRLNFEFDVECYDTELAAELGGVLDAKRAKGRPLSLEEVDSRALPVRLRDGVARLFSPYL